MSIIEDMLVQKAVYWPPGSSVSGGVDFDNYGKPLYGTAVEIDCRWQDVLVEFIAPDGTTQVSHSTVFVDRDVIVGGMLWLGGLAAVSDASVPSNNDGAWEIRRFDKLPDIDADEFLRTVYL